MILVCGITYNHHVYMSCVCVLGHYFRKVARDVMDRPSLPGGLYHTSGSSVSKGAGGGGVQQSGMKRKGSTTTAPTAAVTGAKKGRTAKGATAAVPVEVTKPLALPSIPTSSGSGSAGLYEVVEGLLGQGVLPFAAAACPQVRYYYYCIYLSIITA